MFIDADIGFDAKDVVALLALDRDIIGAPYPKKTINWNAVAAAARRFPEMPPEELANLVGEYVFNPVAESKQFKVSEPVEVLEIGTGFMMIKREIFDKFRETYPEYEYTPDHKGQKHMDGSRKVHAYFHCEIDSVSNRYLSEDYFFCQWVRRMGIKTYLCPWMQLTHSGTYQFTGNLPAIASTLGTL
jgi:hypothetical protein